MSEALELRDIQTLRDFQKALSHYSSGVQEALRVADTEIRRSQDWLQERINHWQRETERAERELSQAQNELQRCKASGYTDQDGRYHAPDCSAQAHALARAEAHLRTCEENLSTAQTWRSRIGQAENEYQSKSRRLLDIAGEHTERACNSLRNLADRYEIARAAASSIGLSDHSPILGTDNSNILIQSPPSESQPKGVTWAEHQAILRKIERGETITLDEFNQLRMPISDLQAGTLIEDTGWIQSIIDSKGYMEAMRDSREAQNLGDAILATLKAINYWRSKS